MAEPGKIFRWANIKSMATHGLELLGIVNEASPDCKRYNDLLEGVSSVTIKLDGKKTYTEYLNLQTVSYLSDCKEVSLVFSDWNTMKESFNETMAKSAVDLL